MSVLPEKVEAYAGEVFFRESWRDLEALAGDDAEQLANQHALILFKPDGLAAGAVEPALAILAEQEFAPAAGAVVCLDRQTTRWLWLYRFNVATVDRVRLHDRVNEAGPSLAVVLRDERAGAPGALPGTVRLTDCKGPSRPERRRPDQLRSRLGVDDRLLNFVHTSDEPADLVRELGVLLAPVERRALLGRLLDPGSWPLWLAAHRPLLEASRAAAPGLWEELAAAVAEIELDEPGVARQTLGDAPPARWRRDREGSPA